MLGIVFGVAAVVAMLSIGAGAQREAMSFIEQMGLRNVIVEAKETSNWDVFQKLRKTSPGLTLRDYRAIRGSVEQVVDGTPRKRFSPSRVIPKSLESLPVVFGVSRNYLRIANLKVAEGRFFSDAENDEASAVCVLGALAREELFGHGAAVGEYVKLDEQWFHVIGVTAPQLTTQSDLSGVKVEDLNNVIYTPLQTALFRLQDNGLHDEIDGLYLQVASPGDTSEAAKIVRTLLQASHHGAADYNVIVPAELLAERRRTEELFDAVMVAIAGVSLLVGSIGIMNIMLASVLERTREIGIRRAVGARKVDIVRQFLVEATLMAFAGGTLGVFLGFFVSDVIAHLARWSTIVTPRSILLAFSVSILVGLLSGIYPAAKAARLDPVEAIRNE
jgi:putative ABC transport system permease protein